MNLWGLWVFLVLLAVGMLTLVWLSGTASRRRERETISSRSGDTLENFLASFRPEVQPVARTVYAQFQQFTFTGKFPFRKSDVMAETLNIDGIDLDEALTKIVDQFGCRRPGKEDDIRFRGRKTLEDYVEFIHHLRNT